MDKKIVVVILLAVILVGLCVYRFAVNDDIKTVISADNSVESAMPEIVQTTPTAEPTPVPTPEPTETPDPYTYNDTFNKEEYVFGYISDKSEETVSNIELACKLIDGIKVMPGETFSFNDSIGEVSEATGFLNAGVYGYDAAEDEQQYLVGGGISMVSSAVYCAAISSVMTPVERYPHKYYLSANSNLRWGRDAYVDNEHDLKFKNDFDCPVLIKVWVNKEEGKVCCQMYGTNPDGLYAITMHNLLSDYLSPPYDYVCIGFYNDMVRDVYDNSGFIRRDSLNYDYDGDGTPDKDYYLRFAKDVIWA